MRQCLIGAFATCAAVVFAAGTATAQDTVFVGFVLPMTGPGRFCWQASVRRRAALYSATW